MESKCDSKVVQNILFKLAIINIALFCIYYDKSIIRIMDAESSNQCLDVPFVSSNINESNNFWAILHDFRPIDISEFTLVGYFTRRVETKNVLVHRCCLTIFDFRVMLVHLNSGTAFAIIFLSRNKDTN